MIETVVRAKISVEVQATALICNKCARRHEVSSPFDMDQQDFHPFTVSGSYGSTFPVDLTTIQFILCGACLRDMVGSFKIDVCTQNDLRYEPVSVIHSETGKTLVVDAGFIYAVGEKFNYELEYPAEDPENQPVRQGIYRHFKSEAALDKLYQVLGCVWDAHTMEPHVYYQALYGASSKFVRPLSLWNAAPDDSGAARFTRIS